MSPRHMARGRRMSFMALLSALLLIAGGAVMLYPAVATLYNNHEQHNASQEYSEVIRARASHKDKNTVPEEVSRARRYNEGLYGAVTDPFVEGTDTESKEYKEYSSILDEDGKGLMGRVRVPSVGIDLPVRHGTSDSVLSSGAGHIYGTALPVGGKGTRPTITSHTGYQTATLFDRLVDVRKGDIIFVDVYDQTYTYKVFKIEKVLPYESEYLQPDPDKELLTLLTCTPYGVNSHRLLVTGERIPTPSSEPSPSYPSTIDDAMSLPTGLKLMGVGGILLVLTGVFSVLRKT